MEIVFAILILIGAVVAGSTSSTSQEVHTEKYPAGDSEQTTVAQSIKAMRGSDGAACVDRGDVQGES